MQPAEYMRLAITKAQEGIAAGQSPFGAAIERGGEVIATAHNIVWMTTDPTAHAEVTCIRQACHVVRDIKLAGSTMYTTCEPCPMCLAAIHWAGIERVVYGATIRDAADAGFNELFLPAKKLVSEGGSPLVVESGLLQAECADLFQQWKREKGAAY